MAKQVELFDKEYDSNEEKWFSYYVNELREHGFLVDAVYHPEPIILSPERSVQVHIKKKGDTEYKSITLLKEVVYEPDWVLIWSKKAKGLFTWSQGGVYANNFYPYRKSHRDNFIPFFASNGETYVDIKGGFAGRNNVSAATFPVKAKWSLQQYGIFVQKVVVSLDEKGLFYRTFFPRSVVYGEVYKKDYVRNKKLIARAGDSKIKCEVKLIEQWLKEMI